MGERVRAPRVFACAGWVTGGCPRAGCPGLWHRAACDHSISLSQDHFWWPAPGRTSSGPAPGGPRVVLCVGRGPLWDGMGPREMKTGGGSQSQLKGNQLCHVCCV